MLKFAIDKVQNFIRYIINYRIVEKNVFLYLFVVIISAIVCIFTFKSLGYIAVILAILVVEIISICIISYFLVKNDINNKMQQLEKLRENLDSIEK